MHTPVAKTAWVSALPVSIAEWGLFVRTREYFDDRHWQGARGRSLGADQVLTRIGYRWPVRHRPVGSITWAEARAYCASLGGRLPWLEEWHSVDDAVGKLDARQVSALQSWLPADRREIFWPGVGSEWCADVYNRAAFGPGVVPERPLRHRTTGHPYRMVPGSHTPGLGFRIVFETVRSACGSAVAGWQLVEPLSVGVYDDVGPEHRGESLNRRVRSS